MNDEQRQYVTVKMAAAMTGIPERTLRRWMTDGQLPAVAAKGGRLVALDDVERLASDARPRHGHDGHAANVADEVATATTAANPTTAEQQVSVIRDGLVAPLVALTERQQERIGELEREAGRTTAELDHARRQAEKAVLEREQIEAERDALLAAQDALRWRVGELEAHQSESFHEPTSTPETQLRRAWWQFWRDS